MGAYDYSQNDIRWKDDPLGRSTFYHMGMWQGRVDVAAGCYVAALAMAASYFGHVITPGELNAHLTSRGLLDANGDIVYNDTLNRLFDDIEYIERRDWPTQPCPLEYFDIRNDLDTEIIVFIDTKAAPGIQPHWLRVVGWDGKSDIIVVDPWDGVRKGLSAYANKEGTSVPKIVYAAIKYHKRQPPAAPAPQQPDNPAPAPPQAPPATAAPAPVSAPGSGAVDTPITQNPPAPDTPPAAAPAAPPSPGTATDIVRPPQSDNTSTGSTPVASSPLIAPEQPGAASGKYTRLSHVLVAIIFLGLPFFSKWAKNSGMNPLLARVITDLVALVALCVAGIAYWHGDGASSGLIIAAVASVYFGHRTAQIQQERK